MTGATAYVSGYCAAAGGVFALFSFLLFARREMLERALSAFPRNRILGMLLTALALVWSAFMIDQMTLGELSKYKSLLYVLTPLSFYLIIQYLDELLAARALGGLLMLAPVAIVDAARWHPSTWRYPVILLAYAMVVAGIWLMLCPFKFRIWTGAIVSGFRRRQVGSIVFAVVAATLFMAAWFTR